MKKRCHILVKVGEGPFDNFQEGGRKETHPDDEDGQWNNIEYLPRVHIGDELLVCSPPHDCLQEFQHIRRGDECAYNGKETCRLLLGKGTDENVELAYEIIGTRESERRYSEEAEESYEDGHNLAEAGIGINVPAVGPFIYDANGKKECARCDTVVEHLKMGPLKTE